MSTKFSTLNVNAVEFVPSFGYSGAAASPVPPSGVAAAAAPPPPNNPPSIPMDTSSSVPNSASVTPATTPESAGSVGSGSGGSTNAINSAAIATGIAAITQPPQSSTESPTQTSPVQTPSTGIAPVEDINIADKIAANNGKLFSLSKRWWTNKGCSSCCNFLSERVVIAALPHLCDVDISFDIKANISLLEKRIYTLV